MGNPAEDATPVSVEIGRLRDLHRPRDISDDSGRRGACGPCRCLLPLCWMQSLDRARGRSFLRYLPVLRYRLPWRHEISNCWPTCNPSSLSVAERCTPDVRGFDGRRTALAG